jgi:hypothetical protein
MTTSLEIFISYSHHDRDLLIDSDYPDEPTRFIRALKPLESIGARITFDAALKPGDIIDAKIIHMLERADLLLAIVSDDFLHSAYCMDIELKGFLSKKGDSGRVIPFYYSSCDWRSIDWLSRRRMIPEARFPFLSIQDRDRRERVLVELRHAIRAHIHEIREG